MNPSKRVVHLTTVHHPYDPRIYYKECLSLRHAGFEVTLIAPADEGTDSSDKPIKIIPTKKYKNRFSRMFFGTFQTYRLGKKLGAAVYHIHDPELLPAAWLLKKKSNVVIYDIHEDYVTSILQKDYLMEPVKKLVASTYKLVEKVLLRKVELCLAEKYYKEMYPNGMCILNYPIICEKLIDHERDYESENNHLLYTGNVSVSRGALIHANIPRISKDVSVNFIGKCPGSLAKQMYQIAEDKKNSIEIQGIDRYIEKEDIDDSYIHGSWLAGIALFPPTDHYMKKELTKFFEYMNAGLPIICSNFPVWKNLIEAYSCGIAVDPYNEEEIRQAIEYIQTNPDVAKQMGENGKNAVSKNINWRTEERKLISWYKRLVTGGTVE